MFAQKTVQQNEIECISMHLYRHGTRGVKHGELHGLDESVDRVKDSGVQSGRKMKGKGERVSLVTVFRMNATLLNSPLSTTNPPESALDL